MDPQHHVAVHERRQRALVDARADGRARHLSPEALRRVHLEVQVVNRELLVERGPRAVRVELRHVRAHRRRDHRARPALLAERRRGPITRSVHERLHPGPVSSAHDAGGTPEITREIQRLPRHRPALERRCRDSRPHLRAPRCARLRRRVLEAPVEPSTDLGGPLRKGAAHSERRPAGARSRRRFELDEQLRGDLLEQRSGRRVGRDGPEPVRIQPVRRRLAELGGVDRRGQRGERRAGLRHDPSPLVALQHRRRPCGHREPPVRRHVAVVGGRVATLRVGVARDGDARGRRRRCTCRRWAFEVTLLKRDREEDRRSEREGSRGLCTHGTLHSMGFHETPRFLRRLAKR